MATDLLGNIEQEFRLHQDDIDTVYEVLVDRIAEIVSRVQIELVNVVTDASGNGSAASTFTKIYKNEPTVTVTPKTSVTLPRCGYTIVTDASGSYTGAMIYIAAGPVSTTIVVSVQIIGKG